MVGGTGVEDAWSHGRRDWGGGPPSPLPRLSQHASRGSGYIGQARPQDVTLSFEFVLSRLLSVEEKKKMSTTRRPLGSLASVLNVRGEESLRRRVPVERTAVERQTIRMYERREETWRPLNRRRVAAFIHLFLLFMVYGENGGVEDALIPSRSDL